MDNVEWNTDHKCKECNVETKECFDLKVENAILKAHIESLNNKPPCNSCKNIAPGNPNPCIHCAFGPTVTCIVYKDGVCDKWNTHRYDKYCDQCGRKF